MRPPEASERLVTLQTVQPWLHEVWPAALPPSSLVPLAADASTRRYWRLCWEPPLPGLPASCIIMLRESWSAAARPDFLTVGEHLRRCGVRVPGVYGVQAAAGIILLEDFGDLSLAAYWQGALAEQRQQWGRQAVDELVKMHTVATRQRNPDCPAFALAFDVSKLLSELQFFRLHAIEGLWAGRLAEAEREELDAAFQSLCLLLAAQPRYFCHRDYHGWNIMVHDDAVGVLDFQDARMGPQPYDLASLLLDRGTPEMLGQDGVRALIDYYLARLEAEEGARSARGDFFELFGYVAVQRCLKAIGTFAYMAGVHRRSQYLPYIEPTLAYVKPLLERYGLLRPLYALLRRYVPLWSA